MTRFCSIDGCGQKMQARGWCSKHYSRWWKYGDPELVSPAGPTTCSIGNEDCSVGKIRRGYCPRHYSRWYEHGDPLVVQRVFAYPAGAACAVDDCDRYIYAKGFCKLHCRRWRDNGDPLLVRKGGGPVTHGMTNTSEFGSWSGAKRRTSKPNHQDWECYGGRGIRMCAGWVESFEAFYKDMGARPDGTSLDRIDVDGNYSCGKCEECIANHWPMNCRWADKSTQARNKRKRAGTTSKFLGVSLHPDGKWVAVVTVDGQNRRVGSFDDEEAAARARDYAAREAFGDESLLNFPLLAHARELAGGSDR